MTYALCPPQQVGQQLVAVVAEIRTRAAGSDRTAMVVGDKRPVFVLVRTGHNIVALDMTGSRVPPDTVTRLCPDAFTRLRDAQATIM